MTDDQQYSIIGRLFTEKVRAERGLAMQMRYAADLGETLLRLGKLLKESPQDIVFKGESFATALGPIAQDAFDISRINGDSIRQVVLDIRAELKTVQEKTNELQTLVK
jgi:hypothetical protein